MVNSNDNPPLHPAKTNAWRSANSIDMSVKTSFDHLSLFKFFGAL